MRINKAGLSCLLFILTSIFCYGQDITMYWLDYSRINPAAYGLKYKFQGTTQYQRTRYKTAGSPEIVSNGFNFKLKKLHGGIGLNHQFLKMGFYKNDFLLIGYSFHFSLKNNRTIGIGTSMGINRYKLESSAFYNLEPRNNIPSNDPPVIEDDIKRSSDFRIGFAYNSPNIETGISYRRGSINTIDEIFGALSYKFSLSEKFYLKPGILVNPHITKSPNGSNRNITYRTNGNICLTLWERLWFGGQYLSEFEYVNDRAGFFVGYKIIGHMNFGYLYLAELTSKNYGFHEFAISYTLQ